MAAWELIGNVTSGQGKGADFTRLAWVRGAFRERLGIEPWPGTLNLRLTDPGQLALWQARARALPIRIAGRDGACDARCAAVQVNGQLAAAIVMPQVQSYPADQVELVAAVPIRETLGLADGDPVTLSFGRERRLEAAIFDVDGTLVNSVDAYHIAAGRAAEPLGYAVTRETVREALNTQQPFWELVVTDPAHRNPSTYAELRRATMRHWEDVLTEHVQVFPAAAAALDRLQAAGIRLGIYTGSQGESFAPLQESGLLEYFEVVLTAADVQDAKPHPEGVLRCLEHMSIEPAAAAYIGDSAPDMGAGLRAGALAVGLLTGAGDSAQLSAAGAHRLAATHEELVHILLGD